MRPTLQPGSNDSDRLQVEYFKVAQVTALQLALQPAGLKRPPGAPLRTYRHGYRYHIPLLDGGRLPVSAPTELKYLSGCLPPSLPALMLP